VTKEDHLAVLRDENKYVVERIRAASLLEMDYWCDPNKSPPNLSREEFKKLLVFIPITAPVRWERRTSDGGLYGRTGEDRVFNIEFEITRGRWRFIYYLKGYFFEKENLKGVCVQSFRLHKKMPKQFLRAIK
jgi:hypothetical protein